MFKKLQILIVCMFSLASFAHNAYAETEAAGQAAAYLQMGIGARALGMGGAFSSIADDATAAFWNPAGLTQLKKAEVSAMTSKINLDRSYDYINFAKPLNNGWTVGFSMIKFGVDDIEETRVLKWQKGYGPGTSGGIDVTKISSAEYSKMENYGDYVYHKDSNNKQHITPVTDDFQKWLDNLNNSDFTNDNLPNGPTGEVKIFSTFEDSEMAFIGSFAKQYDKKLSLGGNFKYLTQKVFDYSASAFGLDLGALYKFNNKLNFGLVVKDLFATMKWDTASSREDKLPIGLVFATSYKIFDKPKKYIDSMVVALDVNKVENNDATLHFGVETWIKNMLSVRAGVNDGDLSVGASFKHKRYRFDYSFGKQELGDIQRLSVAVKF